MIGDDDLHRAIELLPNWLRQQHWFRLGKAEFELRPLSATLLTDNGPRVWHLLVEVHHGDESDIYQVPLSIRRDRVERLDHVHVGMVEDAYVYDALHDKEATTVILEAFARRAQEGDLTFHTLEDAVVPLDEVSLVLPGEHRNTNLAYGDDALLKVFRQVGPGPNPDVEAHRALTEAGCDLVAPLFGWLDGSWKDDSGRIQSANLAMLRGFLTTAADGWALASASVRDLYAEGDLHADEVGGDFASESYRLGMATARVHETMAEVMDTDTLTPPDVAAIADSMHARLDAAIPIVPELEPFAPGLRERFEVLRRRDRPLPIQRIHGSYHLTQVLRTVVGWKLIDFEGETESPIEQRRGLHSPLRDVAHMLRSFDYVAQYLLVTDHPPEDPAHDQIAYRAHEWTQRNSEAFCAGYAAAAQLDPRDELDVIIAYETDKAVYEAVYEARRRPGWLPIPMAAIERLAAPS